MKMLYNRVLVKIKSQLQYQAPSLFIYEAPLYCPTVVGWSAAAGGDSSSSVGGLQCARVNAGCGLINIPNLQFKCRMSVW